MSRLYWDIKMVTNGLLAIILSIPLFSYAQGSSQKSVLFDNGSIKGPYFYSAGLAEGASELLLENGKAVIDDSVLYSPPNAIKLEWLSGTKGEWNIAIKTNRWRNRPVDFGETLSFWVYSSKNLSSAQLPQIALKNQDGEESDQQQLARSIPADTWTQIKKPITTFNFKSSNRNANEVESVIFTQGKADGNRHVLYVDEIKLYDDQEGDRTSPEVPGRLSAKGYDSHIDLSWEPVQANDVNYYVVHRSVDGGEFRPLGIQHTGFNRYTDFLGRQGQSVSYKVSAVDENYNTSGLSKSIEASTEKFSDAQLLDMVQEASFRYYWEGAHPDAGLALENIPGDDDLVATGASGFGIMAIIAGIEREFISRPQGVQRMIKIVRFLEKADRFHGVWPHFLNGKTGKVIPLFGKYDNGGDLVETAFLMQGLLAARQYFKEDSDTEKEIYQRITALWESVEWDWYRKTPGSDFLYWHWSPEWGWQINHKLIGWNETMIVYLLAIASPTHAIPPEMYYSGWASQSEEAVQYRQAWGRTTSGDHYSNGNTYYGHTLDVGVGSGGPLFFTHYSFLGFDPRAIRDKYTNYFENNRTIALINQAYCMDNPLNYKGYGEMGWGLTASDGPNGYQAHETKKSMDSGTLTPTGAISSFPYTPEESMKALKYFYGELGDQLWGIYGFKDAINLDQNWVSPIYMGLNQAPMVVMIENYRTALLWDLFMANPEIEPMLDAIGFTKNQ